MYKEYKDENEQTKIRIQIEDFIHAQLYDKIYSGMAVQDDIKIFQTCVRLSWIQPHHLIRAKGFIFDNFLKNTVENIQKLDDEKLKRIKSTVCIPFIIFFLD